LFYRVVQLNENKLVEICQVNEYVAAKDVKELYDLYNDGNCIDEVVFLQILFRGDQLTVAQARGSAAKCSDHVLSVYVPEGIILRGFYHLLKTVMQNIVYLS